MSRTVGDAGPYIAYANVSRRQLRNAPKLPICVLKAGIWMQCKAKLTTQYSVYGSATLTTQCAKFTLLPFERGNLDAVRGVTEGTVRMYGSEVQRSNAPNSPFKNNKRQKLFIIYMLKYIIPDFASGGNIILGGNVLRGEMYFRTYKQPLPGNMQL